MNARLTGVNFIIADNLRNRREIRNPFIMVREEWERTFDAILDLIAILDEENKVVRVNKAMAERLGVSTESHIGVSCFAAVHGSSLPPDFCLHSKLLKDGKEHIEEVHEENLVDIS